MAAYLEDDSLSPEIKLKRLVQGPAAWGGLQLYSLPVVHHFLVAQSRLITQLEQLQRRISAASINSTGVNQLATEGESENVGQASAFVKRHRFLAPSANGDGSDDVIEGEEGIQLRKQMCARAIQLHDFLRSSTVQQNQLEQGKVRLGWVDDTLRQLFSLLLFFIRFFFFLSVFAFV